jgi:DNA-binding response OmpR family regulator
MRVLIADDNPVFRDVLQKILAGWGYDVITARSGNEAFHLLNSQAEPVVAILDAAMPGVSGVEVCRLIRKTSRRDQVYLILVTMRSQPDELMGGIDAGADDYATKPFNSQELRLRVRAGRRILELQRALVNREQMPVGPMPLRAAAN